MKVFSTLAILSILLVPMTYATDTKPTHQQLRMEPPVFLPDTELLKGAFIEALLRPISKAVRQYGTGRLWYRGMEEIVEVTRPDPEHITSYTVTIRIRTFTGAHNPPYADETMTFKLPELDILSYNVKWLK
jgi:hypothetical protein